MKVLILLIAGFSFSSLRLFGQVYSSDTVSKKAISPIAFIVGDWKGMGYMMMRGGGKESFMQTEKVQYKLDSTVLLIEGLGKRQDGSVIHNAMAVISYNKTKNEYAFQSYLSSGRSGTFKGEIKDGKLIWFPNENIKYTIALNEKGQWLEIGEMTNDKGVTWLKFFELTLDKDK